MLMGVVKTFFLLLQNVWGKYTLPKWTTIEIILFII